MRNYGENNNLSLSGPAEPVSPKPGNFFKFWHSGLGDKRVTKHHAKHFPFVILMWVGACACVCVHVHVHMCVY